VAGVSATFYPDSAAYSLAAESQWNFRPAGWFLNSAHTHTHPPTHPRTYDYYRERRRWERPASTHTTSGKGLYPRGRPLFNINRIGRPGGLNQLTSAVMEVRGGRCVQCILFVRVCVCVLSHAYGIICLQVSHPTEIGHNGETGRARVGSRVVQKLFAIRA